VLGAALLRSFGGAVMPYPTALALAALAWIVAFGLFLFGFAPMLVAPAPRREGR
jgi:uncharacterized protein involved in response to NO